MVNHFIHEIAVVAHYDNTAGEILQILFQYLQSLYIQIIGRLIEHQEIRIAHEHGTQIELAFLTSAELIDKVVLLLWAEHKVLEELAGRHVAASSQIDIVGNIGDDINNFLIVPELQALL